MNQNQLVYKYSIDKREQHVKGIEFAPKNNLAL